MANNEIRTLCGLNQAQPEFYKEIPPDSVTNAWKRIQRTTRWVLLLGVIISTVVAVVLFHFLPANGGTVVIGACASGLISIHVAVRLIMRRYSDERNQR